VPQGRHPFDRTPPARRHRRGRAACLIDALNADPAVHGILVQLPLPKGLNAGPVLDRISPDKDVDGFHPVNVGRLSTGTGGLVPCTPLGIMMLLDSVIDDYRGLNAVVIGKSNIVGKPVSMLLLEREATVTVTHIETKDLPDVARKADIIVAAAGAPHLVRGYWVKPGAVVIDVGITRITDHDGVTKIVGDCATHELDHARAVTPVPGGGADDHRLSSGQYGQGGEDGVEDVRRGRCEGHRPRAPFSVCVGA
jgi:methylenetetrahydrofolate dehydrogenase (NADP+)/methenyltetrahydrofolate cyclohydrolase